MPTLPSSVDLMTSYLSEFMVGIDKYTQRASSFKSAMNFTVEDLCKPPCVVQSDKNAVQ